jgi:ABC-type oligopeptide transport system substrate-binding subunit
LGLPRVGFNKKRMRNVNMKKYISMMAAALVIMFVSLTLTACRPDTGLDSRLVGSWVSDVNDFRYELSDDGTGIRGVTGFMEDIIWSTIGNSEFVITIGFAEERWNYTIRSGILTFTHPTTPELIYPFRRP